LSPRSRRTKPTPQTPRELVVILAAIADDKTSVQTRVPKFTGRFNKGVNYVGYVARFVTECENDLATIAHAVQEYGLPATFNSASSRAPTRMRSKGRFTRVWKGSLLSFTLKPLAEHGSKDRRSRPGRRECIGVAQGRLAEA